MTSDVFLFSIGASCLPRLGFDKLFSSRPTYFYDWLISDLPSLRKSLLAFDENLFLSRYELCDSRLRILDCHTGLRFQHELPFLSDLIHDCTISRERMDEEIGHLRLKYLRRRLRLIDAITTCHSPVLVRYVHDLKLTKNMEIDSYANEVYEIISALKLRKPRLLILSRDFASVLFKRGGSIAIHPIEVEVQRPWQPTAESMAKALQFIKE